MDFKVREGNFLKCNNNVSKMMKHLMIALIPIILFGFYKNGILPFIHGTSNFLEMLWPLVMVIIPALVGLFTEYIWHIIFKDKKDIKYFITDTYAIIPGIFLGLILPINTSLLLLVVGGFTATLIGKLFYGGFGHNIFNPALIGGLFITVCYSTIIGQSGGYLNSYEQTIDALSGATPLGNLGTLNYVGTFSEIVGKFGNLWNFFIGNIPGALGETSAVLILLAFIYLTFNKVLKWRIPVFYVSTVFVITSLLAFTNNLGLWYPLFHILSGGLLFGAVLMATDPITSPITNLGQVIYGICLGMLTVVLRFLTPFPEGVLTAILLMNMFVPIINNICIRANTHKKMKPIIIIILTLLIIIVTFIVHFNIKSDNKSSDSDNTFKIISKEEVNSEIIYNVEGKGFGGLSSYKVKLIVHNDKITEIEVLSSNESYFYLLENSNYIDKIIANQNNLSELDAVSGATYSSNGLKDIVRKVLEDYRSR